MASYLELWLGELNDGEAAAAQALAVSQENGFPVWAAMSRVSLGWARAQLGNPSEGLVLVREGVSALVETGSDVKIRDYHSLAQSQALDGAIGDALATLEDALTANPEERWLRPETFRLRGQIRLRMGQPELAEADFREASGLAQNMSAKMLDLRATTSLARLMRDTNRLDQAGVMLAEVYGWFTEGFDTADLRDARTLLDELGS